MSKITEIEPSTKTEPPANELDNLVNALGENEVFKKLILKLFNQFNQAKVKTENIELPNTVSNQLISMVDKAPEVKIVEKIVEKIVTKEVKTVPQWALNIEIQYQYLQQIKNHPDLSAFLVNTNAEDELNLLTFISRCSQWNNVVRIWDKLSDSCKKTNNAIDDSLLAILSNALFLYNLSLSNHKAELRTPSKNTSYDFELHYAVSGKGDVIQTVLLPALYSASGEKVKSALVIVG